MANDQALDLHYATQMKNHPYGTALYTPLPFSQFHPGSAGYFSSTGSWNPIADLTLPCTSPPLELSPAPSESYTWGPKLSTSTKAVKSSLDIGLSSLVATALPVDIGAFYSFTSQKDGGSVLLTKGDVRHERFYYESPFKAWVKANAERLATERTEVREYGLWVVTSTWSVQEAALNCWREQGRSVGVGFKTGIVGLGDCAPSGEYVVKGSAEGWIRTVSKEGDDGRVVFFGGLRFRYRKIPLGEKLKIVEARKAYRNHGMAHETSTLAVIVTADGQGPEDQEWCALECEPFLEPASQAYPDGDEIEEDEEW